MKHLKSQNEYDEKNDKILFFYNDVLKAAPGLFHNLSIVDNLFMKSLTFTSSFNTKFYIVKYPNDKDWKISHNDKSVVINTLNDVIDFLKSKTDLDRFPQAELEMWEKALEIDESLYLTCPSNILKILKPKLGNVKDYGVFDTNENYILKTDVTDPILIFYFTVFKAAEDFFDELYVNENSTIKWLTFTKSTGQILNTYEIRQQKGRDWEIDLKNGMATESIQNLADVMEFLNRPGKDLIFFKEWDDVQLKIWKKALELDESLYLICPSNILKKIRPALGNVKDYGVFDQS